MRSLIYKFKKLSKKKKLKVISIISGLFLLVVGVLLYFLLFNKNKTPDFIKEEEKTVETRKLNIIDLDSNTRPVAVMINNIAVARKYHSGLDDAYMVYEMVVEGGLTRLMALYKDADAERIGSIRSSRHYYLDYVLENDAIYTHWGYSEFAEADIKSLGINNVNGLVYGNKYFFRDNSLPVSSEHTAFSSMKLINKGIDELGYRKTTQAKPLLNYSYDEVDLSGMEEAKEAKKVDIKYSNSVTTSYTYDEEEKVYKRSVNNEPHMDYVSKKQYTAKNIITYQVKNSTISGDYKDRQNLNNIGNGQGYYITDGVAVPITWSKANRSSKTVYKYLNGEEINVNDGNTYIQIQPVGETLTIS